MDIWSVFYGRLQKGAGHRKEVVVATSASFERWQTGCTFKDAFLRRFAGLLQPFDLLWFLGKKQQRLGDKFAETVVVEFEPEPEQTEAETEDPEKVLENAIAEMKNRLGEAR